MSIIIKVQMPVSNLILEKGTRLQLQYTEFKRVTTTVNQESVSRRNYGQVCVF